jgi:hypothetical protein
VLRGVADAHPPQRLAHRLLWCCHRNDAASCIALRHTAKEEQALQHPPGQVHKVHLLSTWLPAAVS